MLSRSLVIFEAFHRNINFWPLSSSTHLDMISQEYQTYGEKRWKAEERKWGEERVMMRMGFYMRLCFGQRKALRKDADILTCLVSVTENEKNQMAHGLIGNYFIPNLVTQFV